MDGRSNSTGNAREWRRLRALELRTRGWYQRDIAEALGGRVQTISRWLARARVKEVPRSSSPTRHWAARPDSCPSKDA
ncbi:helix-turn-helix domain-containing protein [Singulisphaera acidiphila]|uniref:helix-turn-helix domain-containing protein n=1 Tax=Singulisphaera acidiphila TaxID=466153 RepID=UPI0036F1F0C5